MTLTRLHSTLDRLGGEATAFPLLSIFTFDYFVHRGVLCRCFDDGYGVTVVQLSGVADDNITLLIARGRGGSGIFRLLLWDLSKESQFLVCQLQDFVISSFFDGGGGSGVCGCSFWLGEGLEAWIGLTEE